MAVNQIKVANEAKQDITISKADQILGRLADQTVIAKTVKSIQTGRLNDRDILRNQIPEDGQYKIASISVVNKDRSILNITTILNLNDAMYGLAVGSFNGYDTGASYNFGDGLFAYLKDNGIFVDLSMCLGKTSIPVAKIYNMSWEVIEFY